MDDSLSRNADSAAAPTTEATPHLAARDEIRAEVVFLSGEAGTGPLAGSLAYDPADPYAVRMAITARSGLVVWTFARELLAEGLFDPAGDGDVHVWPCLGSTGEAVVIIELSSPSGTAMLQTGSRGVQAFMEAVYAAVPAGSESRHLAMDDLLHRLLAS